MSSVATDLRSDAPPAARLLLVENDRDLAALLVRLLSDESYEIDVAADGQRGLHLGLTHSYDLVLLEHALSDIDGLALLMSLRRGGMAAPTLVLSELGEPVDRVAGLDAGAEDYLVKPFDGAELLARLRALRRRHLDVARRLRVPGGVLDVDARQVTLHSRPEVPLSARECDLLSTLAVRPRKVFSRDELRAMVFDDSADGVVDTYVHYLRRKLGRSVIDTVRGCGYQLGRLR